MACVAEDAWHALTAHDSKGFSRGGAEARRRGEKLPPRLRVTTSLWHDTRPLIIVYRFMRIRSKARAWPAALLIALACGSPEPRFPNYSPDSGNPELLTDEDVAVYEAVMSAYGTPGQIFGMVPAPPPPPGSRPAPDGELPKSASEPAVRLRPYTSQRTDVHPENDRWRDLADRKLPPLVVPESVVTDFNRRNRHRASLRRFHPKHLRIEWSEGTVIGSALFSLTLPGYSPSHDVAIVEVSVVTSPMSGGGEVLYLRKAGQTWRVVAKQGTWIS
jgi:hypothetical protein